MSAEGLWIDLWEWTGDNNLLLYVGKTKDTVIDFSRIRTTL